MNERDVNGTVWSYSSGYVLSILLTLAAYFLVTRHTFSGWSLGYVITALAVLQFFVQLVFFLHVGRRANRRWNLMALAFMIIIVFILVVGSIWIMHNLNYRMTPQQINQYMQDQDGGI